MPHILVVDRAGEEHEVPATVGYSIMEIIRDGGLDGLLALCGGCCSCATCHVHVDPAYRVSLPAMTDDEDELLDEAPDRDESSRLSCQLIFDIELEGIRVRIGADT